MRTYVINGGKELNGEVNISGSKNAALPIMAASILNRGITKLYNVPEIHDTKIMLEILRKLGCQITKNSDKIVIDSRNIKQFEIPENLMREMRSSVIFAGSILGIHKKVKLSYPGGCDIGARPIDLHLKAFKKLGVDVIEEAGVINCSCERIIGNEITLDFPSVGATENSILASVLAEGITEIKNAAMEPEIVDLQNFLNRMGANISGAGGKTIVVRGVTKLKDVSYNIMPDRIEAGTYLCMVAATGGKVKLNSVIPEHLTPIISKLEESGSKLDIAKDTIIIKSNKNNRAVDIKTMPYPGFPTDMQSIFATILTIAKGSSIIVENIFENRYRYTQELIRMGAKISIEGKTAVIKGTRKLYGASVKATDLRGGAALVMAGISAKGTTKVEDIEYILRGYEKFDKKLQKLGVDIELVKG